MMETIVYTFCAYLPIHLLAYLPFFDFLRFGKGWIAVTVVGNLLIHLSGVAWAMTAGRPELVMAVGMAMVPISLALCALACRPMYRLFRYAARQVYHIDAPRLWRVIWLIPAMMSGMVTVFTGNLENNLAGTWQFLLTRASLLLCVVVVSWVLLSALEGIQQQAALQEKLNFETHLLEVQIAEQKKYSQLMVEHTTELRRQRHDLRHQLTAIRGLTRADNAPLCEYLDSLLDAIPAVPQAYCANQAVNVIVSHYATLCQEQGVDTDIWLTVPSRTEQVTDAELCVIFGNLWENAMKACGRVKPKNGKFRSGKRDDFGVGLSSIQAVARKRGGGAWFEPDGRVFRSSVYLRI